MPYKNQEKNRKYQREWQRKFKLRHKLEVFDIYNNKCNNCGETRKILLQFHHTKGKKNKETLTVLSRRIAKANKKVDDIELLCANCHILANIRDGTANYMLSGY